MNQLDNLIEKAQGKKYIKRTGTPGNYKYEYEEETGRKSGSGNNVDDEIKDIKDNIELYDNNYNVYRRRYLQTQSDEHRYKLNKWLNLRKEQEKLLKEKEEKLKELDKKSKFLQDEGVSVSGLSDEGIEAVYQGPKEKYNGKIMKIVREEDGTNTVIVDEKEGRKILNVPDSDLRFVESKTSKHISDMSKEEKHSTAAKMGIEGHDKMSEKELDKKLVDKKIDSELKEDFKKSFDENIEILKSK